MATDKEIERIDDFVFHFTGQPQSEWPEWAQQYTSGEYTTCWFIRTAGRYSENDMANYHWLALKILTSLTAVEQVRTSEQKARWFCVWCGHGKEALNGLCPGCHRFSNIDGAEQASASEGGDKEQLAQLRRLLGMAVHSVENQANWDKPPYSIWYHEAKTLVSGND